MTDMARAEVALAEARARAEFVTGQQTETAQRLQAERDRLSALLANGNDERSVRRLEDEIVRLGIRVQGFEKAKADAAAAIAEAERVLDEAKRAARREQLEAMRAEFAALDREALNALRAAGLPFARRRALEGQWGAIAEGAPAPRFLLVAKSDLGPEWPTFREALLRLLEHEHFRVLPVRRPGAAEEEPR